MFTEVASGEASLILKENCEEDAVFFCLQVKLWEELMPGQQQPFCDSEGVT